MIVRLLEKSFLTNSLPVQHILARNLEQKYHPRFQANECFEDSKALTLQSSRLSGEHSSSIDKQELIRQSIDGELGEDNLSF